MTGNKKRKLELHLDSPVRFKLSVNRGHGRGRGWLCPRVDFITEINVLNLRVRTEWSMCVVRAQIKKDWAAAWRDGWIDEAAGGRNQIYDFHARPRQHGGGGGPARKSIDPSAHCTWTGSPSYSTPYFSSVTDSIGLTHADSSSCSPRGRASIIYALTYPPNSEPGSMFISETGCFCLVTL